MVIKRKKWVVVFAFVCFLTSYECDGVFMINGVYFFVAFALGELCVLCFGCMVVFVGHQSKTKLEWRIYTKNFSIGNKQVFWRIILCFR